MKSKFKAEWLEIEGQELPPCYAGRRARVIIVFPVYSNEQRAALADALGQPLTTKTKSVWFPRLLRNLPRQPRAAKSLTPMKPHPPVRCDWKRERCDALNAEGSTYCEKHTVISDDEFFRKYPEYEKGRVRPPWETQSR
jgi:hypothetical protein